jgi:hypothetical protein
MQHEQAGSKARLPQQKGCPRVSQVAERLPQGQAAEAPALDSGPALGPGSRGSGTRVAERE